MNRVQRGRGKRAWNQLTWGMLITRSTYGSHLNRFYHRGIPKAERLKWNVRWRGGMRTRHRWLGRDAIAVRGGVALCRGSEPTLPKLKKRAQPLARRSSQLESAAAVLMGMLDRNYEVVPERGLPVNRRRAKRGVPASMTEFRDAAASQSEDPSLNRTHDSGRGLLAPAPSAIKEPDLNEVKGRRYATSLHVATAEFAAWGQRMAEKARQRGG